MKRVFAPLLLTCLSAPAWGQPAPVQNSWVYEVLPPGAARPVAVGLHNCLDQYPADAKATGIEGITSLSYGIADDGTVKNVSIRKSSGNAKLDEAAAACVKSWLYTPATLDDKPIEIAWRNDVKWVIAVNPAISWPPPPAMPACPPPPPPGSPPPVNAITTQSKVANPPPISWPASIGGPHVCLSLYPPEAVAERAQGTVTIGFIITTEGNTDGNRVIKSSGYAALDDAALLCTAGWRYKPALKDGQPVAAMWKAEVKWLMH